MSRADFLNWYRRRQNQFEQNQVDRKANAIVARNLLDIFTENPEAFNVLRYMNIRGPVHYNTAQENFGMYLYGWYMRTPQRWQPYVHEIMNRFGFGGMVEVSLPDRGALE